ncbi:MAG TPA: DUF2235 domain-containing protein [Gammaproteobacteria bacterium]|nr:DUF2235 domain-containing protein [Gammaproteobacteria bacterium]
MVVPLGGACRATCRTPICSPSRTTTIPATRFSFFGFGRGAYTGRSVAGLFRKSGPLKREYAGKLNTAYEFYRDRTDTTHPGSIGAELFRKSF